MTDLKISVHQLQTDRGRVQLLRKYLVKNIIRFKFVMENEIVRKLVVSISSENKRWKKSDMVFNSVSISSQIIT